MGGCFVWADMKVDHADFLQRFHSPYPPFGSSTPAPYGEKGMRMAHYGSCPALSQTQDDLVVMGNPSQTESGSIKTYLYGDKFDHAMLCKSWDKSGTIPLFCVLTNGWKTDQTVLWSFDMVSAWACFIAVWFVLVVNLVWSWLHC